MRNPRHLLPVLLAGVLSAYAADARAASYASTVRAKPAPNFELRTLDGHLIALSQLKGKIVLLDFWASWCAPCVAELPDFVKLQARLKRNGLVVIGVALDNQDAADHDAERKLKNFVASHGIDYPIVEITPRFNVDYGKVLGLRGGRIVGANGLIAASLPCWVIVDRAGNVRAIHQSSAEEPKVISGLIALTR